MTLRSCSGFKRAGITLRVDEERSNNPTRIDSIIPSAQEPLPAVEAPTLFRVTPEALDTTCDAQRDADRGLQRRRRSSPLARSSAQPALKRCLAYIDRVATGVAAPACRVTILPVATIRLTRDMITSRGRNNLQSKCRYSSCLLHRVSCIWQVCSSTPLEPRKAPTLLKGTQETVDTTCDARCDADRGPQRWRRSPLAARAGPGFKRTALFLSALRLYGSCDASKPFALQAVRFRIAGHRPPAAPSWVQAAHRARSPGPGIAGFCARRFIHGRSWTTCGNPRAIRNPNSRIHQAGQRLLVRLTQSLTYMNLTFLKLATAGTGEKSRAGRHDRAALPSGHAHPYRIDLA